MRRWLLNIFAGLSLLLILAVVTLWVRSYRVWYMCVYECTNSQQHRQVVYSVTVDEGLICLDHESLRLPARKPQLQWHSGPHGGWMPDSSASGAFGFYMRKIDYRNKGPEELVLTDVWFPSWALLPPLMIAPALWLRRWRRERRTRGRGFAVIATDEGR